MTALSLYLVRQRFISAETAKRTAAAGNDEKYDLRHFPAHEPSVLSGRKILFLGSSVTYGAASGGQSFVELFEKLDFNVIKTWITTDARKGRENERWVNILVKK